MGSRNLTIVVLDGVIRVAQYGQDGADPRLSGAYIARFLESVKIEAFTHAVRQCYAITDEERNALMRQIREAFPKSDAHAILERLRPELHRNTGCRVLPLILMGTCELYLDTEFAADSDQCEWAYVIDLDRNCYEVYRANQTPLTEGDRFYFLQTDIPVYPVKLWQGFDLSETPITEELFRKTIETRFKFEEEKDGSVFDPVKLG